MWQCAECDYRVKNSNDLRKHVERKHLECRVPATSAFKFSTVGTDCNNITEVLTRMLSDLSIEINPKQTRFISATLIPIAKGEAPSYD